MLSLVLSENVLRTLWHFLQRKLCPRAFPTDVFNELRHALKIDEPLQVLIDDDDNDDNDDIVNEYLKWSSWIYHDD